MMKKQKRNNEDNRGVAIYARKSRITNKGDSIGVQFKQCAEYAKRELQLDDDYSFMEYEDKGLSGYYSDRPSFQRMLHDIEMGKIRAIVCYKLDRIGRKTSDLLRLLDFLEKHKVDLLICSNNINTASGVSKIFIQIFAVVAEFERDTLTERITDNMMELAKDGRWLGGNTPTGFTVKRVKTGSGKNKSAYSYLESIPEEKAMIQKLYEILASTRSIKKTADKMNELGYRTKIGSKFNTSTTRLLLKNPVYCVADEIAYNYFYENGGGVCAELSEFDGQHGLSAYNKTDQEKFEDADSTFISPKFVQLMSAKPVSEWIISVGRHEGFIPSQQWIDTQNMLDSIAEKYNRPHRKTNALLAGLVYCPHCGKRLRVISESNRWTNGKPRFKYVCPGYRLGECTFRAVDGVLLDEFVVKQLSNLSDEDSEYFVKLLNQKASDIFKNTHNEQELIELKKKKTQLEAAISNQVKNLREADDNLKRFIQEDVKGLTDDLSETEKLLQKLEDSRQSQMYAVRDIEEIKERLLSFEKYAKDAQPDVLVTLIQSFVERIYIVDENDERYCHIFIKGCTKEDYDEFFRATGYISGARETVTITHKLPLCDSDKCCKRYKCYDFSDNSMYADKILGSIAYYNFKKKYHIINLYPALERMYHQNRLYMIYSGTFDPYHTGERDLYLSIGQCKVNICYVIYGNVNKRHDIAYSVTVTFTDDYDFEHWTKSKKNLLTMCINNILGYYPQSLGLIVPYSWRIQYKFSGTFRCRH